MAGSRLRVLLVDDHQDNLLTLAEMLAVNEWELRCAFSGAEALSLAPEFEPDVVLADLAMPQLDGISLCRQLRRHPRLRHTRWVAYTGFCDSGTELACLNAGFERLLCKPRPIEEIERVILGPR